MSLPGREALIALARDAPTAALAAEAGRLRDRGHGAVASYSPKVFIPLTRLCRDVCHYCTFARPPRRGERAYLSPDEVLAIARAGAEAGCREALFTLGDKPERRYRAAREELARLGFDTTIGYLAAMAGLVAKETGLLPHLNPGVTTRDELAALRETSVSQGLMLESAAERLCRPGGPHHGSPDKRPAARLETLRLAGALAIPFTSGILIGIGETREERIDALLALRDLHEEYGHVQEIIVQSFRAKPGTRMADAPEPELEELIRTVAVARIAFGAAMNVQAPPNLTPTGHARLIAAGINDWGGVSPVTPDHVNPEAPWPQLAALRRATGAAGKTLVERLAVYPAYALDGARWQTPATATTSSAVSASTVCAAVAITPIFISALITSTLRSAIRLASSWTGMVSGTTTSRTILAVSSAPRCARRSRSRARRSEARLRARSSSSRAWATVSLPVRRRCSPRLGASRRAGSGRPGRRPRAALSSSLSARGPSAPPSTRRSWA